MTEITYKELNLYLNNGYELSTHRSPIPAVSVFGFEIPHKNRNIQYSDQLKSQNKKYAIIFYVAPQGAFSSLVFDFWPLLLVQQGYYL